MVEGSLEKKPPFEKPSIEQVKKDKRSPPPAFFFYCLRMNKPSHLPSILLAGLEAFIKSVEIVLGPLNQK